MALDEKYQLDQSKTLRDARPFSERFVDNAKDPAIATMTFGMTIAALNIPVEGYYYVAYFGDLILLLAFFYFWWLMTRQLKLPFSLPKSANRIDPNNVKPNGKKGKADGVLYLGNEKKTGEEIWFTDSNARTHCLYLGTTGAGKTEGLKSYACNALTWSSGFIYVDGKADTGLWSTISAQARRFGRDDDLLLMNYMTGNIAGRVASNTLNPFSSGSASYLTNMLTSLMPDAGGDNAMWKERAVALVAALLPCLVYKREKMNIPMNIGMIRVHLTFKAIIQLSRDEKIPTHIRQPVRAYLEELPGYVDDVFDDNGDEKPGDHGADTGTPRQQHGYLSMQFTRSMQSLGDDYGFIFDAQAADIDMTDVVLQRRMLIVLIPALEKSGDETANLGKIIASTLKGMMGATLGNTVEGDTATAIDNKPTTASTPFIAIFDEVGYYTAQGMAVMAAQARSLGFSLVYAGQDLPAMQKRVKEEAQSITANCNIKLFGKLEDPTQTKDFFEKTVGHATVTEVQGFARQGSSKGYIDSNSASLQKKARADYDELRAFTEGRAICAFGQGVREIQVYYSSIGHAKAMRVHRFLPIVPPSEAGLDALRRANAILQRLRDPKWKADAQPTEKNQDIEAMVQGFTMGLKNKVNLLDCGIMAVANISAVRGNIKPSDANTAIPATEQAPEPQLQKEIESAHEIMEKTDGKAPLSWAEVIGGSGDAAATVEQELSTLPAQQPPPVTEPQQAAPEQAPQAAAAGQPAASAVQDIAQNTMGKGPLSWMDVIGGTEGTLQTEQPVPTVPEQPPAQPAPPASDEKQDSSLEPMNWMDVIGATPDTIKDDEN